MATSGQRWAFWLETQLEDKNWRPADLVRASGLKENGRPVIDAPRVSAWLRGERPSYELAGVAGEALSVGAAAARTAAGYGGETESRDPGHDGTPEDEQAVGRGRNGGPVLPLEGLTEEQQTQLRQLAELFRSQNPKA